MVYCIQKGRVIHMTKAINFDMDGTLADFYGVDNWLEYLVNKDAYPYAAAKPLVNMSVLARYLNRLQRNGYEINIISWLAKNSSNICNFAAAAVVSSPQRSTIEENSRKGNKDEIFYCQIHC